VQAMVGAIGQEQQQLDQLFAPGACLPEHRPAQNYLKEDPGTRSHQPGPASADQRVFQL
jgi:hypothetical protein